MAGPACASKDVRVLDRPGSAREWAQWSAVAGVGAARETFGGLRTGSRFR